MGYPSNLTDKEWALIQDIFKYGSYGKSAKYEKRTLVNAVFYLTKTGCQWRQLPQDFPPWKSVYSFFKRAKEKDLWEKVMQCLVEKSRKQAGKTEEPSYSIIDSQSVKTTDKAINRGIDGGKKNQGA